MTKSPGTNHRSKYLGEIRTNVRTQLPQSEVKVSSSDIPKLPLDPQKFNKLIGYPKHPSTLVPSPILDYQLEYIKAIMNDLRVILNKSRKIGATETALRAICQQCYSEYIGHNVLIVAGNRQPEANVMLERFKDLFVDGWTDLNDRHWAYRDLIMNERSDRVDLYSGVTVRTIPANHRALRGQANVKCVFFTEAAHIDSLNDEKVWGAVKPMVANDDTAAVVVESTPAGIRGFFHDEFHNDQNGYKKMEYDYTWGLRGGLFTNQFIDQEKKDPRPWYFPQEYGAQFLAGGKAAITIPDQARLDGELVDLDTL